MNVFINDKATECVAGATLKQALAASGIDTEHAAVALDLEVIPREAWDETRPREGSQIIIIKAARGG